MAAEAEAAREARAKVKNNCLKMENISEISSKVIAAEGEQKASRALREASNTIAESSSALQVRLARNLTPADFGVTFLKFPTLKILPLTLQ